MVRQDDALPRDSRRVGQLPASLELSAAHLNIEKNGWQHVETTSEEIPGDGCGGGEGPFVLYTLWVDANDESVQTSV